MASEKDAIYEFKFDVQPFLDILETSTDRLQGLTVCMEALEGLTADLKEVDEALAAYLAEEPLEPTEEGLAAGAARRAELLDDIRANVAAIVATDRLIAKHKAEATD